MKRYSTEQDRFDICYQVTLRVSHHQAKDLDWKYSIRGEVRRAMVYLFDNSDDIIDYDRLSCDVQTRLEGKL